MAKTTSLGALTLAFACLAAACGDSTAATDGGGGAGGGAGTGGAAGAEEGGAGGHGSSVTVRFFVDEHPEDPEDAEVEASIARYSDPIRIVVEGLVPATPTRLDFNQGSYAVFAAHDDGTIDTARDAPVEGTWTSADVDGPLWSAPVSDAYVPDVIVDVSDADTGAALASGTIHRRSVDEDVDATPVADGTRVGLLARPAGSTGKHPAVLVFGGSEGGSSTGEFFAYYLAQLGYVSFGVAYFGETGLPSTLTRVPLETLEDDLDFLASQPDVDPERIAVIGGSRGGELALLLGAHYPDRVHAVVAQIPSGYVWGSTSSISDPAWTLDGADLPYVPYSGAEPEQHVENGEVHVAYRSVFLADIAAAPPEALDLATTHVEDTNGPILFLAGEDDQLWPSCVLSQVSWDRLQASGHVDAHGDELHCFPDAGHFIAFPPGSSTMESTSYFNSQIHAYLDVGGTPQGIAKAERDGNTALRAFLARAL